MARKYRLSPTDKLSYVHKAQSKEQRKETRKQVLILLRLLGLIGLIIFPSFKKGQKGNELKSEIDEIKEEIAKYEKTNSDLKDLLIYLESDQAAEEKARLNLGLQKEGEKVVVIKRMMKENNLELESKKEEENLSNPRRWLKYFFDN